VYSSLAATAAAASPARFPFRMLNQPDQENTVVVPYQVGLVVSGKKSKKARDT
jgi:hypothetical protein